jgi:hypothetical protein
MWAKRETRGCLTAAVATELEETQEHHKHKDCFLGWAVSLIRIRTILTHRENKGYQEREAKMTSAAQDRKRGELALPADPSSNSDRVRDCTTRDDSTGCLAVVSDTSSPQCKSRHTLTNSCVVIHTESLVSLRTLGSKSFPHKKS